MPNLNFSTFLSTSPRHSNTIECCLLLRQSARCEARMHFKKYRQFSIYQATIRRSTRTCINCATLGRQVQKLFTTFRPGSLLVNLCCNAGTARQSHQHHAVGYGLMICSMQISCRTIKFANHKPTTTTRQHVLPFSARYEAVTPRSALLVCQNHLGSNARAACLPAPGLVTCSVPAKRWL